MLSGFFVAQLVLGDDVLEVEISSDHVSGRHDVVVVHSLDEGLDLGAPLDLLLAHTASHPQWVLFNPGNKCVGELLVLCTVRYDDNLTFFPSSCCLTMIAFFPACLPARRITTRPGFIL